MGGTALFPLLRVSRTQSSGDMKVGEQSPGQLPSHPSGAEIHILQGSFESDWVAAGEVCSLTIQKPKRW